MRLVPEGTARTAVPPYSVSNLLSLFRKLNFVSQEREVTQ
jgi:hypothetical protein